jgi:hypothetical protein
MTDQRDEFLASAGTDAVIENEQRQVIATERWRPYPMVVDGPFDRENAIFYSGFLISKSLFSAGTYNLIIKYENARFIALNGPNAIETPKSFKAFTFKISSSSAQETSTDLMSPKDFLNSMLLISKNAQSNLLAVVKAKATGPCCRYEPLSEYPSPVLFPKDMTASRLKAHEQKVNEWLSFEVSNFDIKRITAETNAVEDDPETLKAEEKCKKDANPYSQELKNVYSDFSTIQEQYTLEIKNFSPLTNLKNLKQVQNLLLQNQLNSKKLMTEVMTKNNNSSCLIWKSLLADLENHSALYLNLKKSVDQFVIDAEEENISRERVEASKKSTISEDDLRKKAIADAARANEKAAAENLIKNKAANSEVELEELAAQEEDPSGDLTVTYTSSSKSYVIKADTNLIEEEIYLRATKKGAKALRFDLKTNGEGQLGFKSKIKLSGFTLALYFGKIKLDSIKIK